MIRFTPSRSLHTVAVVALAIAAASFWGAAHWAQAAILGIFMVAAATGLAYLASRQAIELTAQFVKIGARKIAWTDIARLDRTGWFFPLIVRVTLADGDHLWLVYAGSTTSSNRLLRLLFRSAKSAMLDGTPQEALQSAAVSQRKVAASPRYRLLREEDELEVERLYQRLKTVGNLDPKGSSEDK